jgi:1-acyl-sn-glycerol-3-phosphate acyltransferase
MTRPEIARTRLEQWPHGLLDDARAIVWLAIIVLAVLVLLPVQMVAHALGLPLQRLIPMAFHRIAAQALGLRIRVQGRIDARRPLLLAANHVSWADIVVLGSLVPLSFVAKGDVASWPIVGLFAKLQRCVFVNRKSRMAAGRDAEAMAERMKGGDPLVLFAEGTSGDGNTILPFKPALIGAAAAVAREGAGDALVQPVTLAYARFNGIAAGRQHRVYMNWLGDLSLGPHVWALLKAGALDVDVVFGDPVMLAEGLTRKEAARLMEKSVRETHAAALRGQL